MCTNFYLHEAGRWINALDTAETLGGWGRVLRSTPHFCLCPLLAHTKYKTEIVVPSNISWCTPLHTLYHTRYIIQRSHERETSAFGAPTSTTKRLLGSFITHSMLVVVPSPCCVVRCALSFFVLFPFYFCFEKNNEYSSHRSILQLSIFSFLIIFLLL